MIIRYVKERGKIDVSKLTKLTKLSIAKLNAYLNRMKSDTFADIIKDPEINRLFKDYKY